MRSTGRQNAMNDAYQCYVSCSSYFQVLKRENYCLSQITALLERWGLAPTSFCNHNTLLHSACDFLLLSPFSLLQRLPCLILPILSKLVLPISLVSIECLLIDSNNFLNFLEDLNRIKLGNYCHQHEETFS